MTQVAPLPDLPRPEYCDYVQCHVRWSPGSAAFLYLEGFNTASLLGLTDGSALWDVRGLLRGASGFRWGPPR